jgi:processive 1,2-diacylglycerol beta-glucosyltransferase
MLVGLALALAAAMLYAAGVALQAIEAREIPEEHAMRVSLLRRLVARPRWIAGTAAGLAGWALQALALLFAPLTLVQPAIATGLVFLLPVCRRVLRERVGRRETAAVVLAAAGLAAVAWAAPARDANHVGGARLAASFIVLAAVALLPYGVPRRLRTPGLLAVAAGVAYAWDGLATKFFTDDAGRALWLGAVVWVVVMFAGSGLGTLSEMSALQKGAATRVAPIVAALGTLAAVALAPLLARETVPAGDLERAALAGGLAAVIVGVAVLARSPSVATLLSGGFARSHAAPQASRSGRLVLLLSAEEGEGHTSVARALAATLVDEGADVVMHDALAGSLGHIIPFFTRDAYRVQLRRFAWTYGLEYRFFTRFPPARALARRGLALLGARPLARLIRRYDPDVIVSTHPTVTAVLGALRRRGRLDVPVVAMISDFGVHPLWTHKQVDVHLVVHDSCVEAVELAAGRGSARVCRAPVAEEFRRQLAKRDARAALGLPQGRTVVLVSGGGWGVGALDDAARGVLALPDATVVCLTGRNDSLRRRLEAGFADEPRILVLGFTDRMPELLAAADALVDATIGVTCLEALSCGCPIVLAGAPPGHSRDNAHAIARAGLAVLARDPSLLVETLQSVTAAAPAELDTASRPSAASLILAAERRYTRKRPVPRIVAVGAASLTLMLGLSGWTLASPQPYPLLSHVLELRPLTRLRTQEPVVGLLVNASRGQARVAAAALATDRVHASLALASLPAAGLPPGQIVPTLEPLDLDHPLRARGQLAALVQALGLRRSFYYLTPAGMALAGYLAAQSLGGKPVAGQAVRPGEVVPATLSRGQIVVLELGPRADVARSIERLVRGLRRRGLRPVTLAQLVAASRASL